VLHVKLLLTCKLMFNCLSKLHDVRFENAGIYIVDVLLEVLHVFIGNFLSAFYFSSKNFINTLRAGS